MANIKKYHTEEEKKEARKQYRINYALKNKEKLEERKNDTSKFYNSKEYRNNKTKEFREKNYEKYLLYQIKASAKKRNLEFNLTIEDIVIPKICKYLGIEITKTIGNGLLDSAPSVDRIDSNKGYIKGNIQIISQLANKVKSNLSISQLVIFANNIILLHK